MVGSRQASWWQTLHLPAKMLQPYYVPMVWFAVLFVSLEVLVAVIAEVFKCQGMWAAASHVAWGSWLLLNICYHYHQAVTRSPGSTQDFDLYVLKDAMTHDWRWCCRCNRPKPPLCHHCTTCNKCILRMDHHCPWMNNTIGLNNYHHFYLFTLYLTLGSAYASIASALQHGPRFSDRSVSLAGYHGIFLACVISGAVCCGLLVLLVWHSVVAVSGYGTLELMDRWLGPESSDDQDQDDIGSYHQLLPHVRCAFWQYKHSLGPLHNWRRAFCVSGPWWWVRWCLPGAAENRSRPGGGLAGCCLKDGVFW